jgi:hypothetical protein
VICDLAVTFETREPPAAALKFDRDDIEIAAIVGTASVSVDLDTVYFFAMDQELQSIPPYQWFAYTNKPRGSAGLEPEA